MQFRVEVAERTAQASGNASYQQRRGVNYSARIPFGKIMNECPAVHKITGDCRHSSLSRGRIRLYALVDHPMGSGKVFCRF